MIREIPFARHLPLSARQPRSFCPLVILPARHPARIVILPGSMLTGTLNAQVNLITERLLPLPGGETMIRILVCAAVLIGIFVSASQAQATGSKSLNVLAKQYRVAVHNFEKTVLSVRGVDRGDERLVDRLDDASARMRLASKNPRHLNRLFYEWRDVQKLHAEVERTIFGKYTPNHDLVQAWNLVAYNYVLFAEEYFYQIENPGHDGAVKRIPLNSARRNSYLSEAPITPLNITRLPSGAILVPPPQ